MEELEPIFRSDRDKEFEERTKKIIEQKFIEQDELRKKQVVMDKIEAIKKTVKDKTDKDKTGLVDPIGHGHDEDIDCPSCKGHSLHVHDGVAKCTGAGCGKEYFLKERSEKKKDYICTTCGDGFTKDEALKLADKKCPMCGKGEDFIALPWDKIGEILKSRKLKKVNAK